MNWQTIIIILFIAVGLYLLYQLIINATPGSIFNKV